MTNDGRGRHSSECDCGDCRAQVLAVIKTKRIRMSSNEKNNVLYAIDHCIDTAKHQLYLVETEITEINEQLTNLEERRKELIDDQSNLNTHIKLLEKVYTKLENDK